MYGLLSSTLYYWYQDFLSDYQDDKEKGKFPNQTLIQTDETTAEIIKEKPVYILKPSNIGQKMNIDDKVIGHSEYTILSNTDTGKIAMFVESTKGEELGQAMSLFDKKILENIKHISCDMSPTYLSLCREEIPRAEISIDKFHVMSYVYDAVLDYRSAKKRKLAKGLTKGKNKTEKDKEKLIQIDLLNRCRYRLTQSADKWSETTKELMNTIFKKHRKLKTAYDLSQNFKEWYDIKNYNEAEKKDKLKIKEALSKWYDKVKNSKIKEFISVVKMIKKHEYEILNYFSCGHTNANAENLNSKIQRFVAANFGTRNKVFSIYRIAGYFS
jgi:transposase